MAWLSRGRPTQLGADPWQTLGEPLAFCAFFCNESVAKERQDILVSHGHRQLVNARGIHAPTQE